MKLTEALALERIDLDLISRAKLPAIEEMIGLVARSLPLGEAGPIVARVLEREGLSSTAVDHGIAIPHAHCEEVSGVVAALGISRQGLDYEAPDGRLVHLVFLILAAPTATPAYLSVLGRTARIFHREEVRHQVREAASPGEVLALIARHEPF
ncbi:MAG: PTS sugar transporter subunit IIA [Gemmatimonadota bacterium]